MECCHRGGVKKRFKTDQSVLAVAYSPDGGTFSLWARRREGSGYGMFATGELKQHFARHGSAVLTVSYSPDGSTLASGSVDSTVHLWDVMTGERIRILRGHSGGVRSVVYSPDGRTLVSGSMDETLRVWDVATGEGCQKTLKTPQSVLSVSYAPDGQTLAAGARRREGPGVGYDDRQTHPNPERASAVGG